MIKAPFLHVSDCNHYVPIYMSDLLETFPQTLHRLAPCCGRGSVHARNTGGSFNKDFFA